MELSHFRKVLLGTAGVSQKKKNGMLTVAYAAMMDHLFEYDWETIKGFIQLLEGCGFKNHAKRLIRYSQGINLVDNIMTSRAEVERMMAEARAERARLLSEEAALADPVLFPV